MCITLLKELCKTSWRTINSWHGKNQGCTAAHCNPQGQLVRSLGVLLPLHIFRKLFEDGATRGPEGGEPGHSYGELNPACRCQDLGLPELQEAGLIPSPADSPFCSGRAPCSPEEKLPCVSPCSRHHRLLQLPVLQWGKPRPRAIRAQGPQRGSGGAEVPPKTGSPELGSLSPLGLLSQVPVTVFLLA